MARPQKEGLDYFPHDTDACTDEKVEALMMVHGTKGYAFYFIMLERIYRTPNCELDISDAETIQILSKKIGINTEEFNLILKSAIKYKCFCREKYENELILTSKGIKNRANIVIEKRIKMREKYSNTTSKVSDAETREETREETRKKPDKVKESKEKKSIYYNNVFLTAEQYERLKLKYGEEDMNRKIEKLSLYICSSGRKYKCHYSTILAWDLKDNKKTASSSTISQPEQKQTLRERFPGIQL